MRELTASAGVRRVARGMLPPLLLLLAACEGYSGQEAVAEGFLRAAVEGRSPAELVEGSQPLEWLDAIRRAEPLLLETISTDLEVRFGDEQDGVTAIDFLLQTADDEETLGMEFVRRDGVWKILYVQLSDRL